MADVQLRHCGLRHHFCILFLGAENEGGVVVSLVTGCERQVVFVLVDLVLFLDGTTREELGLLDVILFFVVTEANICILLRRDQGVESARRGTGIQKGETVVLYFAV